jgi:hypothetical protein
MDLKDIGCSYIDWIDLAQDRDQCRLLWTRWWNFGFNKIIGKLLSSCANAGFSRNARLHEVSYFVNCYPAM